MNWMKLFSACSKPIVRGHDVFISYAQNFEDVILWRALKHIENGFYIDVGAQDPIIDSVSLAFYERGWRGVHVEPSADYAEALRKTRPDEKVLEALVSDVQGDVLFYDISATGLSTANADIAARHVSEGYQVVLRSVAPARLATILDSYRDRDIHWLKIDVEGEEPSVIRSWRPSEVRPWIVVVESVDPILHEDRSAIWEADLLGLGYALAYADGLNRFYVSNAHPELAKALAAPPSLFDGFSFSGTSSAPFCSVLTSQLAAASDRLNRHAVQEAELRNQLAELRTENQKSETEYSAREAESRLEVATLRAQGEQAQAAHAAREQDLRNRLDELQTGKRHFEIKLVQLEATLAAREQDFKRQVAALQDEKQNLHAELVRLEADRATQLNELKRLHNSIAERDIWGESAMQQIAALSTRIADLHRSKSWRITGPLRRASRVVTLGAAASIPVPGALARRVASFARTHAPCWYGTLASSPSARALYHKLVRPRPQIAALANVPLQVDPPRSHQTTSPEADLAPVSQWGGSLDTHGQLMRAMARWNKGRRIHA